MDNKHRIVSVSLDPKTLTLIDARRRKTLASRSAIVRDAVQTAFDPKAAQEPAKEAK